MGLTSPPSEKRGLIKTTHLPGSAMPGTWPVPSEWHLPPEAAYGSDAESRDREGRSWLPQWGTEYMLCALPLWAPRETQGWGCSPFSPLLPQGYRAERTSQSHLLPNHTAQVLCYNEGSGQWGRRANPKWSGDERTRSVISLPGPRF